jgi:hypothetical protein
VAFVDGISAALMVAAGIVAVTAIAVAILAPRHEPQAASEAEPEAANDSDRESGEERDMAEAEEPELALT